MGGFRGSVRSGGSRIFAIPDFRALVVTVWVPETIIDQIPIGHLVKIKAEPFIKDAFTGKIAAIAVLPDAQATFERGPKLYRVRVQPDTTPPQLAPGMNATAWMEVRDRHVEARVPLARWRCAGTAPPSP